MKDQARRSPAPAMTKRGSRPDAVYALLRRAILEQALRPGVKLPEDGIGEKLGVSRTVVRRALERLRAEELVEIEPNRGATVACPTLEQGQDVLAVRIDLEQIVIQRLCGQLSQAQQDRLQACIADEASAHQAGRPDYLRHAVRFHVMLAEMTGSALLQKYVKTLIARSALVLGLHGRPDWPNCSIEEHRAVLAALVDNDEQRAWCVMKSHLDNVLQHALGRGDARAESGVLDVIASYAHRLTRE